MANFDPGDVHIRQALTDYSVSYMNEETIWRDVAPLVEVDKRSDSYFVLPSDTNFNQTVDNISPHGDVNEIAMALSSDNYSVRDYALMALVDQTAVDNADVVLEPLTEMGLRLVRQQLENRQEVRVANAVFANAAFAAANRATLSGTSQWSDFVNSDPIQAILTALDIPLQRPNTITMSSDVWRVVRGHPRVVAAIYPNGGNSANRGKVNSADFLALFADEGITKVNIGRARVNTAKPGVAPTLVRAWGRHCSLTYVAAGTSKYDPSFAKTFASSVSNPTVWLDEKKGLKGSYYVKDGWSVDIKVTAQLAGYFFENAVA